MTIETFNLTRAIALYRKGWTAKAIAADQGCSLSTVYSRLREAGIKRRQSASAAAATLGKLGGNARTKSLSPERRSEISRQAANVRWGGPATGKPVRSQPS